MQINVNNVNLYYDAVGTGSPLILIYGNRESHEIFDEAVKLLSEHFTCYFLDTWFIAESAPDAALRILPGEDHDSCIVGSTKVAELILEYCGKK